MIEKVYSNSLSIVELFTIDTSGTDFYHTQYQILESQTLAQDVIERLNLSQSPEFRRSEKRKTNSPTGITVPPVGNPPSEDDSAMIGAFLERLNIQPIRNSRLVKVNFESQDPQLAARAVNTLAQAYIDWGLSVRMKTQQNTSSFLVEQVNEVK
jgi:succinoglycan biosynthesis transport protein ExoP